MNNDQSPRAGDGDLRASAQQAIEALEKIGRHFGIRRLGESTLADSNARCEAHAAVEALRAALAAAPAAATAGWISVADRLPPKFAEVMIAFAGSALPSTGQYTGNRRDSADGWSYPSENSGDDADWTVTHWRPLPEHPESNRFAGSADAAALAAVPSPATGPESQS